MRVIFPVIALGIVTLQCHADAVLPKATLQRVATTSLRLPKDLDVNQVRSQLTEAFPGVTFEKPVAIATPPGARRAPEAQPDADPDNDGAANRCEYLLRSSPLDPQPPFNPAISVGAGFAEVSFPQIANRIYEVQFTDSLNPPVTWNPLKTWANHPVPFATNRLGTVRDVTTNETSRLYRLSIRAPERFRPKRSGIGTIPNRRSWQKPRSRR